jgi:hypothetical protein
LYDGGDFFFESGYASGLLLLSFAEQSSPFAKPPGILGGFALGCVVN